MRLSRLSARSYQRICVVSKRKELSEHSAALASEIEQKTADFEAGKMSTSSFNDFMEQANAEAQSLQSTVANYDRAQAFRNSQAGLELAPGAGGFVGSSGGFGGPRPQTPMQLSDHQIKALYAAACNRMPLSMELNASDAPYAGGYGGGGVTDATLKGFTTKAAATGTVSESGLGGGFSGNLPPVQSLYAVGLGYEPTRISSYLPGATMQGPSATWLSHVGNTQEASGTPELAIKGIIAPSITENQVRPQKIAGIVSTSLEAWQDTENYGEGALASWLPAELTRSLINTESQYLLTATTGSTNAFGGPTGATFDGWFNTTGTLTRAADTAGGEFPLDTLNKAMIDVRTGPGYAEPDLCVMHPTTLGALRRLRDNQGRYILDLLAGPLGLTADGSQRIAAPPERANAFSVVPQGNEGGFYGNLWGVPIVASTQCPAGSAVVASIKAGGGLFWQRLGLMLQFSMGLPGSEWESNAYSWRVEERVALSVPRPSALNIVDGLPTA
jgi:hypothetical protein